MLPPSNSGASVSLVSPFTRLLPSASSPLSENFRPCMQWQLAVRYIQCGCEAYRGCCSLHLPVAGRGGMLCFSSAVLLASMGSACKRHLGAHAARTLIQQRVASSTVAKALRRQSAADTTTSMSLGCAMGRASGFSFR